MHEHIDHTNPKSQKKLFDSIRKSRKERTQDQAQKKRHEDELMDKNYKVKVNEGFDAVKAKKHDEELAHLMKVYVSTSIKIPNNEGLDLNQSHVVKLEA